MVRPFRWIILAVASGGYLSYLPVLLRRRRVWKGSGLVGSLWGLVALPWLPQSGFPCLAVLLLVTGISIFLSDMAERALRSHDDPRIVIDEFVGYWVTMAWLPRRWEYIAIGFVLFRVLDVFKLPWVRRAGRLPGGVGVVADDVFAGVVSNLALQLVRLGIHQ